METRERRTPREVRVRRAVVMLSSWQTALGNVIIAMSFTAFACSSSEKIRSACPYWAGFTVLFTGSVGFLTWKQLSIISIGIYTFLSAVSVIVHLVATVLTGDLAGFLRTLKVCKQVKFEHACGCCVMNTNCQLPYKFPSVRDCSILNGFVKDLMYGLCAVNVVCCLICLGVTVMGCTLVAQYNRYSQTLGFRWHQRPSRTTDDHRHNWLAFPSDPSNHIPPCAPPIYFPVESNPENQETRNRRPPTVFDPVDFPPPYSSREPSESGRADADSFEMEHPLMTSEQRNPLEIETELENGYHDHDLHNRCQESGNVSEEDHGHSSSSFGIVAGYHVSGEGELVSTLGDVPGHGQASCNVEDDDPGVSIEHDLYHQLNVPHATDRGRHRIRAYGTTDFDDVTDTIFDIASSRRSNKQCAESGAGCEEIAFTQTEIRRRHSYPHNSGTTEFDEVYNPHDEIYRPVVAHNLNPWSRAMSDPEVVVFHERDYPRRRKRRANSVPYCATAPNSVLMLHKSCQTTSNVRKTDVCRNDLVEASVEDAPSGKRSVGAEELGDLFRNFKESKCAGAKCKRRKRKRRPRNNPDHILEREDEKGFTLRIGESRNVGDWKETTL